ncbi:helix-turn-helix domain-containing protein [Chitinophaga sp. NPDC101104]|uniref:helix-turn-helix domain-containing protein n=1 Tax=Chitinophaga sp. NPDC101104 TaxID=3390561 RepID=UPI003D0070B1
MTSEVLLYIHHHLDSKISLESLGKVTGYSPFHLQKKLSRELGTPLGKYIQEQRLHTAAYLLALTRLPILDIMAMVGFEDNSAFGRAFKKLYAVPPLQYRTSQTHQQAHPHQTSRYISTNGIICREAPKTARIFTSRGDYFSRESFAIWEDVAAYIASIGRTPDDFEHYSVFHECPHITGSRDSRFDAAIVPKGFTLPAEPFLQSQILDGKFIKFNFCSAVQEYESVSAEVNNAVAAQPEIRHREGASYFRYDSMPSPRNPDNLFINWYLPIA